ncbi:hypothetical protein TgHK011_004429 [Trichoderma gracile]|nr:hypothetical protein TgHK011_004429 [Trichoderma gracile]
MRPRLCVERTTRSLHKGHRMMEKCRTRPGHSTTSRDSDTSIPARERGRLSSRNDVRLNLEAVVEHRRQGSC